jgi:hypothetical protein
MNENEKNQRNALNRIKSATHEFAASLRQPGCCPKSRQGWIDLIGRHAEKIILAANSGLDDL